MIMNKFEFTLQEKLDIHMALLSRYTTVLVIIKEHNDAGRTESADEYADELERILEVIAKIEGR